MNIRGMLQREERCVLHAYADHLGYLTIGWGRLIDQRKGGGLSQAEADLLLDNDLARVEAALVDTLPWFRGLCEPRRAVLAGMAYQMGLEGLLGFRSTLASVRDERFADAAEGMRRSLWARQTPARARRMAHQMETGDWA